VTWYFVFFFLSGFCCVLYELVWLRLSMAQFGVTTAMVSIVLSVFMAGLGLGSWVSGRWLRQREGASAIPALRLYALIELLIGVFGVIVPYSLAWGGRVLESAGLLSSIAHYSTAGLWVAFTLLPGCTLMGATLPVGMRAIAQRLPAQSSRSFSYLYMANVAGALAGTILPLLLIEWLGFRGTLWVGAACNVLIAASALVLSRIPAKTEDTKPRTKVRSKAAYSKRQDMVPLGSGNALIPLFLSGLTSMAMEVVWVRRYAPFLGTVVYAFASILAVYLVATFAGSLIYRRWSSRHTVESPYLWIWLASFALLPLVAANASFEMWPGLRLVLGIAPFTGLLGLITPMLVDRYSGGDSTKGGVAYAINVVGCILGPLLGGFCLLPFMSERWALLALASPWVIVGLSRIRRGEDGARRLHLPVYASLAAAVLLVATGKGIDEDYRNQRILRDSTATVIASGTGLDKQLLVNGYGMTSLTPITKVMAHLPVAFLDRKAENALVICFGMGTTFRALHSWGIQVTAVELVPSVPRMFSYYHSDADAVLNSASSRVIIDDGRRYLERANEQYDVITIDPPPPLEAAASSLLYSEEFYRLAKRRLRSGGILQQWLPLMGGSDQVVVMSVTRSLHNSFPYVRAFFDLAGIHYLCSDRPIPSRTAEELVLRMPAAALEDFTEWAERLAAGPKAEAFVQYSNLLQRELPMEKFATRFADAPPLTDDRPINEYYLYRRWANGNSAPAEQGTAQN
jgi:predicted membrane-bound spermidine synthase